MKKLVMLLMVMAISIAQPKPAQAMIGLSTNDAALTVAGLVLMDISQITVWERRDDVRRDRFGNIRVYSYYTYRVITYPAFLIGGFVLLDAQGDLKLKSSLTQELIEKAQLTNDELLAYQNQIEEINSIMEMISKEVSAVKSDKEKFELSGQLWSEYAQMLDVDAAVALKKIGIALQN